MSKFAVGDWVVPLFEEEHKVLKVLDVREKTLTTETELGFEISVIGNYRHATQKEINERLGESNMRLVPFMEERIIQRELRDRNIENSMVVDSLWKEKEQEQKVISECAGCENDIFAGEDVYEFTSEAGENVLIHQNLECCRHYISEQSRCLVAGEK
jgi:hypothetical protein